MWCAGLTLGTLVLGVACGCLVCFTQFPPPLVIWVAMVSSVTAFALIAGGVIFKLMEFITLMVIPFVLVRPRQLT